MAVLPVRVLVTGERSWRCEALAHRVVEGLKARHGAALVVVHDVDGQAELAVDVACFALKVARDPHPLDYHRHGDDAERRGWRAMLGFGAGLCVILHRRLRDDRAMRRRAREAIDAGVPTWLVEGEDGTSRRLTGEDI